LISSIANQVDGIIQTYLPGNHGGDALADILSGEVNPSGKLPYSYPLFQNALTNYNFKPSQVQDNAQGAYNYVGVVKNLFDFGHGLSYTTFETSQLKVDATQVGRSDSLTISVKVKNTGKVAGKETVMLFSKDHYASLSPDIKRLRRFEKVNLSAGETKELTFTLPVQELAFVNADLETVVEPGTFDLMIGNEKVEITVE
jgi:beta-glucosidase